MHIFHDDNDDDILAGIPRAGNDVEALDVPADSDDDAPARRQVPDSWSALTDDDIDERLRAVADSWTAAGDDDTDGDRWTDEISDTLGHDALIELLGTVDGPPRTLAGVLATDVFLRAEIDGIRKTTRYRRREIADTAEEIYTLSQRDPHSARGRAVESLTNLHESLGWMTRRQKFSPGKRIEARDLTEGAARILRLLDAPVPAAPSPTTRLGRR